MTSIPDTHGSITALSVSQDGSRIGFGESTGSVRVIELLTGRNLYRYSDSGLSSIKSLAFSSHDGLLAYGTEHGKVIISDPFYWPIPIKKGGERQISHGHEIKAIVFFPGGEWMVSVSDTVRVWKADASRDPWRKYLANSINQVRSSGDGRIIATIQQARTDTEPPNATIRLFETRNGQELSFGYDYHDARSVSLSHDGRLLAVGTRNGLLHVWDIEKKLQLLEHRYAASVNSVFWCCDDKLLTAADGTGVVNMWEIRNSPVVRKAFTVEHPVFYVHASARGDWFSAAGNGLVWLWRLESDKAVPLKDTERVVQAGVSPDGRYLAGAEPDGVVRLWDLRTQTEIGHASLDEAVEDLDFSNDGKLYVTTFRYVMVLEVPGAKVLFRVQLPIGMHTAALLPGGRWIIVGTFLGELAQIAVPTFERQHEDACTQLSRDLYLDEWREFLGSVSFRKQCSNPRSRSLTELISFVR